MTKKFNRKTITVTTDSMYKFDPITGSPNYNPTETELLHDALNVLLNSVNPYKNEYPNMDYNAIFSIKHQQEILITQMMHLLKNSK